MNRGQESRLEQDSRRLLLDRPPELFASVYIPLPGSPLSYVAFSLSLFLFVSRCLLSTPLTRSLPPPFANTRNPVSSLSSLLSASSRNDKFPGLKSRSVRGHDHTTTADRFRFHRGVHVYIRTADERGSTACTGFMRPCLLA